jgi:hypothetical protein
MRNLLKPEGMDDRIIRYWGVKPPTQRPPDSWHGFDSPLNLLRQGLVDGAKRRIAPPCGRRVEDWHVTPGGYTAVYRRGCRALPE